MAMAKVPETGDIDAAGDWRLTAAAAGEKAFAIAL